MSRCAPSSLARQPSGAAAPVRCWQGSRPTACSTLAACRRPASHRFGSVSACVTATAAAHTQHRCNGMRDPACDHHRQHQFHWKLLPHQHLPHCISALVHCCGAAAGICLWCGARLLEITALQLHQLRWLRLRYNQACHRQPATFWRLQPPSILLPLSLDMTPGITVQYRLIAGTKQLERACTAHTISGNRHCSEASGSGWSASATTAGSTPSASPSSSS